MAYLTYEEYKKFGFESIEEIEFDKLIRKASDVVESVTRYFYAYNNIDDDVKFRREQFKKAIAAQVEYFHEMGATTSYGLNEPTTVQIGRTSMSSGSRGSQNAQAPKNDIVSSEVYMYLAHTGLLYRGIGVRS